MVTIGWPARGSPGRGSHGEIPPGGSPGAIPPGRKRPFYTPCRPEDLREIMDFRKLWGPKHQPNIRFLIGNQLQSGCTERSTYTRARVPADLAQAPDGGGKVGGGSGEGFFIGFA